MFLVVESLYSEILLKSQRPRKHSGDLFYFSSKAYYSLVEFQSKIMYSTDENAVFE